MSNCRLAAGVAYLDGLALQALDAADELERRSLVGQLQGRLARAVCYVDRLSLGAYRVSLHTSDGIPCPVYGEPVELLAPCLRPRAR